MVSKDRPAKILSVFGVTCPSSSVSKLTPWRIGQVELLSMSHVAIGNANNLQAVGSRAMGEGLKEAALLSQAACSCDTSMVETGCDPRPPREGCFISLKVAINCRVDGTVIRNGSSE